jgi:molybdate transport system permease protein
MASSADDDPINSLQSGDPGTYRVRSDVPFLACFGVLAGAYIVLIALLVLVDVLFLFKPADRQALIARQDGVVRLFEAQRPRLIQIEPDRGGELVELSVPDERVIVVVAGESVRRGTKLTDGELSGVDAMYSALVSPDIRYSIALSLISCTISTLLSLLVAVPIGYLMSRFYFPFKSLIDTVLDIPIVLPPLVIGISLLVLFNFPPFDWFSDYVVFEIPAVILAQFTVACAFAVRTMRVTFDQIPERFEHVALTSGCNRAQAFWKVIFPQARRGLLAAGTLAWARSLGEFGPILVFAGSTRQHTEVLPTSVYLEMQAGSLPGMLAVSMIMIVAAVSVLLIARLSGLRGGQW